MRFHSFFSVLVSSLAFVAGLVYGNVRLGEMFYEIGLESEAGLHAIELDLSHLGGEARILVQSLAMQAEITKTDLSILQRDVEAQYASIRTNVTPKRARPLSRERRD